MDAPGSSGHSSGSRSSISCPPPPLPPPEDNRIYRIQESGRLELPRLNPVSASAQSLSVPPMASPSPHPIHGPSHSTSSFESPWDALERLLVVPVIAALASNRDIRTIGPGLEAQNVILILDVPSTPFQNINRQHELGCRLERWIPSLIDSCLPGRGFSLPKDVEFMQKVAKVYTRCGDFRVFILRIFRRMFQTGNSASAGEMWKFIIAIFKTHLLDCILPYLTAAAIGVLQDDGVRCHAKRRRESEKILALFEMWRVLKECSMTEGAVPLYFPGSRSFQFPSATILSGWQNPLVDFICNTCKSFLGGLYSSMPLEEFLKVLNLVANRERNRALRIMGSGSARYLEMRILQAFADLHEPSLQGNIIQLIQSNNFSQLRDLRNVYRKCIPKGNRLEQEYCEIVREKTEAVLATIQKSLAPFRQTLPPHTMRDFASNAGYALIPIPGRKVRVFDFIPLFDLLDIHDNFVESSERISVAFGNRVERAFQSLMSGAAEGVLVEAMSAGFSSALKCILTSGVMSRSEWPGDVDVGKFSIALKLIAYLKDRSKKTLCELCHVHLEVYFRGEFSPPSSINLTDLKTLLTAVTKPLNAHCVTDGILKFLSETKVISLVQAQFQEILKGTHNGNAVDPESRLMAHAADRWPADIQDAFKVPGFIARQEREMKRRMYQIDKRISIKWDHGRSPVGLESNLKSKYGYPVRLHVFAPQACVLIALASEKEMGFTSLMKAVMKENPVLPEGVRDQEVLECVIRSLMNPYPLLLNTSGSQCVSTGVFALNKTFVPNESEVKIALNFPVGNPANRSETDVS